MDKEVGRNDPCPCGSGKKYKKCCLAKAQAARQFHAKVIDPGADMLTNMLFAAAAAQAQAETAAKMKKIKKMKSEEESHEGSGDPALAVENPGEALEKSPESQEGG